jgi:hypothetical protein
MVREDVPVQVMVVAKSSAFNLLDMIDILYEVVLSP